MWAGGWTLGLRHRASCVMQHAGPRPTRIWPTRRTPPRGRYVALYAQAAEEAGKATCTTVTDLSAHPFRGGSVVREETFHAAEPAPAGAGAGSAGSGGVDHIHTTISSALAGIEGAPGACIGAAVQAYLRARAG